MKLFFNYTVGTEATNVNFTSILFHCSQRLSTIIELSREIRYR